MQKSHLMKFPVHLRHNSQQTRNGRQTPQCDVTKRPQSHPFKGHQEVGNIHASPTNPCKANRGSLLSHHAPCHSQCDRTSPRRCANAAGCRHAHVLRTFFPCGRKAHKVVLVQEDIDEVGKRAGPFLMSSEI